MLLTVIMQVIDSVEEQICMALSAELFHPVCVRVLVMEISSSNC